MRNCINGVIRTAISLSLEADRLIGRKGEKMIENGKRYLVTADNWFQAPDGESYRAAWGVCELKKTEDVFGFTPARPSTNWFIKVGTEENHVIIAGCQIHFAVRSEKRPTSKHEGKYYKDKDSGIELHEERIYFTE